MGRKFYKGERKMFLILVISLIIYIIGVIAIYHNMYSVDKSKKIQFIMVGFLVILLLTMLLVFISSNNINIENREYKSYSQYISTTKTMSILLFAPINSIIVLPYIGNLLNKYTDQRINGEQLKKKILICAVILILVVIFEIGYVKDFQTGLIKNALNANEF